VDDDAASIAPLDDDGPAGERRASLKCRAVGAACVVGAVEVLADDVDAPGPAVDLPHDVATLLGSLDVVTEVAVAADEEEQRE
jgi:hypothetical protein